MPRPALKSVNLWLDGELLSLARDLKIDLSRAAEDGIERAVKAERERVWRIENAEAIRLESGYIETNGLPLAKHRQF
jgi:antitoxin CcdA